MTLKTTAQPLLKGVVSSPFAFVGLVPHPPIIVPEIAGERSVAVEKTINAMKDLSGRLVQCQIDTCIVISPHAPRLSRSFGIFQNERLKGDFSAFGRPEINLGFENDMDLTERILEKAEQGEVSVNQLPNSELDHGTLVPAWFLEDAGYRGKLCVLSLSNFSDKEHIQLGALLRSVAEQSGKRIALIASGDMSHRLKENAPAGFHPDGKIFDHKFVESLKEGDHHALLSIESNLVKNAGQDVSETTTIALSALEWNLSRRDILSYEGPFGVGYTTAVLWEAEDSPAVIEGRVLPELARNALEAYVKDSNMVSYPGSPDGYLARKHGAFVTVWKKNGELRGCIGIMEPTKPNLPEQIIDRAIATARYSAFGRITEKDDLSEFVYEVSVLYSAEPVADPEEELRPDRFGALMIADSGKRAVLLPGIESIRTPSDQVSSLYRKGSIDPEEPVQLFRFAADQFHEAAK